MTSTVTPTPATLAARAAVVADHDGRPGLRARAGDGRPCSATARSSSRRPCWWSLALVAARHVAARVDDARPSARTGTPSARPSPCRRCSSPPSSDRRASAPTWPCPPIVAGVRHGWSPRSTSPWSPALTAGGDASLPTRRRRRRRASARRCHGSSIGLGVGLLASWQSRSTRDLAARQAPYAAAHHLMARIHQLASSGSLGLDSASLATELDAAMRQATGCARVDRLRRRPGRHAPRRSTAATTSTGSPQEIELPDAERTPGAAVVPLRGAQQVLGYCVLVGVPRWTPELDERAHEVADEFALRLDTAVLFDEVRALATSEERNRIAREMHDGVAQEIVGLGYIVDEIESISDQRADPRARVGAARRDHPPRRRRSASPSSTCATRSPTAGCPARWPTTPARSATPPACGCTSPWPSPGRRSRRGPRPRCCAWRRRPSATCASTRAPTTCG